MTRGAILVLLALTCATTASAQDASSACQADGEERSVSAFLDCARAATARYHDPAAATLDGYRVIGRDFPAMGEHWINVSLLFDGRFDAAHPEVLTYTVIGGVPRLLGVAYALPLLAGEATPNWPPGMNAWHDHARTLESETVLPQHDAHGHPAQMARLSMLHAWIWTDNPGGMFTAENWTIPFLRLGLAAPVGTSPAAAKAVSLVTGGLDYLLAMIDATVKLAPPARRAVAEIVNSSETAIREVLAGRSDSALSSADVDALATKWSELWAQLDGAVAPETARQLKLVQIR